MNTDGVFHSHEISNIKIIRIHMRTTPRVELFKTNDVAS